MPLPELRWRIGHGVEVAYSTAAHGDQRDVARRQDFLSPLLGTRPCIIPRQIHGALVVDAQNPDLSQADGVATGNPALALGAYGADCPGVVIVSGDALAVGHCGWRGTAGGMVARLVAAVAERSATPPEHWMAFIGPGISGARYEVDAPVLAARTWPAAAVVPTGSGHARLDLATTLESDLRSHGIQRITSAGICTADDPRLHSYRHRGSGLVQLLVAWRGG